MIRAEPDRRRGAALFVVLMMSALLAGLAAVAMRSGVSGTRAASVFAETAQADELGRAAGDIVAYRLATGDKEARRGGSLLVRLADAEIAITYVSESARVDVNAAPLGLIGALLSAAGAGPPLVEAVTTRIEHLRATPGAVKADHNVSILGTSTGADPPAGADGSRIENTAEVAALWDLPDGLARKILPTLTAHGGKTVDPILADRRILLALLGGDDIRVDDYLERRLQGFVNADAALALLPVPSKAFAGVDDVSAVRVLAHVTVAHRLERRYDMVLAPAKGQDQDHVVVSWQKLP